LSTHSTDVKFQFRLFRGSNWAEKCLYPHRVLLGDEAACETVLVRERLMVVTRTCFCNEILLIV
jgi:hypothetical protein